MPRMLPLLQRYGRFNLGQSVFVFFYFLFPARLSDKGLSLVFDFLSLQHVQVLVLVSSLCDISELSEVINLLFKIQNMKQ